MESKKLLTIAIISSLLGILFILYIGENFGLSKIDINQIDENYLEKNVKIRGVIDNLYLGNKVTIMNVKDNSGNIKVVAFDNSTGLKEGMAIEVNGKVSEYKNELEIVSERIKSA